MWRFGQRSSPPSPRERRQARVQRPLRATVHHPDALRPPVVEQLLRFEHGVDILFGFSTGRALPEHSSTHVAGEVVREDDGV